MFIDKEYFQWKQTNRTTKRFLDNDRNLHSLQFFVQNNPNVTITDWANFVNAHLEPDPYFDWAPANTRGVAASELTAEELKAITDRIRKAAGPDRQVLREESEKAAEVAKEKRLSDPRIIEQARRESDNVVSLYRGHTHSETARHRPILAETLVTKPGSDEIDWFATLDARKAKATELYDGKVWR
jgi:hypothetical protein